MKSSIEKINPVQQRVKITVSSQVVNKTFDSVYEGVRQKAKIHGFRPGKAPLSIVKKSCSDQFIKQEVGEKLVEKHLKEALMKGGVSPVAHPLVETLKVPTEDKEYEFSVIVDIMPNIQLNDEHKKLSVTCKKLLINDKTVESELEKLARTHAKEEDLEQTAQAKKGHLLIISHTAKMGEESVHELTSRSIRVVLGEDQLLPELESALIGMQAGQVKKVSLTLAADYQNTNYAGKAIDLHLSLEKVMSFELPNLDDEFAAKLACKTMEELREKIKKNLEDHYSKLNRQEQEEVSLRALAKKVSFEVPPSMIERLVNTMYSEFQLDEASQKKMQQDEKLRNMFRQRAKTNIQNTLLLLEISKQEDIKVSKEELNTRIKEEKIRQAQENKQHSHSHSHTPNVRQIEDNMLLEKSLKWLADNAKVTYTF